MSRRWSSVVAGSMALSLVLGCAHQGSKPTPSREAEMYTVLVTAKFKSADPAVNKKAHDEVASATRQLAESRGDIGHRVVVDPADPRSFVAIDTWTSLEGMQQHFSDPNFLQGFGTIFEGPPTVRVFRTLAGGTQWGSLSPAPGNLVVTVEAPLAAASDGENVANHNRVAGGGRETAQQLGDVTHLAFLDNADPRQFLGLDIWTNPDGLKTFMSNPQAQQAFASMFAGPPKVTVYAATDYYQW